MDVKKREQENRKPKKKKNLSFHLCYRICSVSFGLIRFGTDESKVKAKKKKKGEKNIVKAGSIGTVARSNHQPGYN